MKRAIFFTALLLVGIAVLSYPWLAQWYADQSMTSVTQGYPADVDQFSKAQQEEQYQKAIVYNDSISGRVLQDPFVVGSGMVLPEGYTTLLDFDGTGLMATLSIPALQLDLPVYHGVGEDSLSRGIGHIPTTALPVGGEGTHCVLVGHRGLVMKRLFTELDQLQVGDKFFLQVVDHHLAYQVDQITMVLPDETDTLMPETGKDYVTLVTCTPYGINTHRLLVRGHRIPYVPADEAEKGGVKPLSAGNRVLLVAGIITTLVMITLIIIAWRRSHLVKPS